MKGFVFGILVAIAVAVAGVYLFVRSGALPAGQDVKPGSLERWAAKTSLRATIQRQTSGLTDPLPASDENLAAGIPLYVTHCQVCHGGPDGKPSVIAKGLSPVAPQLAKHGIRFTGMPAFGQTLSQKEIWQVTQFLKRMDALSPAAREAWAAGKTGP